jgi:hypothetical protein
LSFSSASSLDCTACSHQQQQQQQQQQQLPWVTNTALIVSLSHKERVGRGAHLLLLLHVPGNQHG